MNFLQIVCDLPSNYHLIIIMYLSIHQTFLLATFDFDFSLNIYSTKHYRYRIVGNFKGLIFKYF